MELNSKEMNFLSFENKINGFEYPIMSIARYLFLLVITFVLAFFIGVADGLMGGDGTGLFASFFGSMLFFVMMVLAVWTSFAIAIQRLNDMRADRAWSICLLIPIVNVFFGLILILAASKNGKK